jgi:hypothetical protein
MPRPATIGFDEWMRLLLGPDPDPDLIEEARELQVPRSWWVR